MKNTIITVLSFAILLAGCTGDFDEMNRNPNNITEVTPALLLPAMQRAAVNAQADNFERGEALYTLLYCQFLGNTLSGFNSDRYEFSNDWATAGLWLPFYTIVRRNFLDIRNMATKYPEYEEMYHIARIVAALGTARTTDIFGDVPYSEACIGMDKPKYDAQKDIYYDILKELSEATSALSNGFGVEQKKYGTSDMYYQGDARKWIKFGNSLRLRYALRISFIDPQKAKQEGEAALAATLMETVSDKAYTVTVTANSGHPLLVITGWSDGTMSATFERIYKTTSTVVDPRMECRWGVTKQSVKAGTPEFKGVANGLPGDQAAALTEQTSLPWGLLWTPGWNTVHTDPNKNQALDYDIMLYSEVCFLKAEAAIQGWAGAGNAQANYETGIRASFEESRKGVNTALYSTANDEPYITTGNVKWNEADDFETKLKKISTQKWVSLFPNGSEAWAECRRTGYPALTPVVRSDDPTINAANGEFIKKLRYVNTELESNEENARSASLNGGKGDGQNVRVWWDTGRYK
jgi:hypothetical protein